MKASRHSSSLHLGTPVEVRKPNAVFVLAATSVGPNSVAQHLQQTPPRPPLAKQGSASPTHAAAPVCSPYRAALLTGQYPARIGILDYLRPNSSNALPASQVTLPETLQHHGYATGMVGKWHLTGYKHHDAEFELRPGDHGFGWNLGSEVKGVGNGASFFPYVAPSPYGLTSRKPPQKANT